MIDKYVERSDFRVKTRLIGNICLDEGRSLIGLIDDISFGGMKLRLYERLSAGSRLTINFSLADVELNLNALARWSLPLGLFNQDEYHNGVYFMNLDQEQQRLLRLLIYQIARS